MSKLCLKCKETKSLEEWFYKTTQSWQSYCISCHNKRRDDYPRYKKKEKGFAKLPEEKRKGIIDDISRGKNYTETALKYGIVYWTLLRWRKEGSIFPTLKK